MSEEVSLEHAIEVLMKLRKRENKKLRNEFCRAGPQRKVTNLGNSLGITLPKSLESTGFPRKKGQRLDMYTKEEEHPETGETRPCIVVFPVETDE